jgi:hypothetical protein
MKALYTISTGGGYGLSTGGGYGLIRKSLPDRLNGSGK